VFEKSEIIVIFTKNMKKFMNAKDAKDLCFFTPPNPQLSRQTQGEKPQIMYGW